MARPSYGYRTDPKVPRFPDDKPILVYDGHCALCSGFARFVIRHDRAGHIRLMAAQSPTGEALYRHLGLDPVDYKTNIVLEHGTALLESESSIRIFELLGLPWSLARVARLLPVALRDRLYRVIARNRLRWFGRREACYLGDRVEAERFIA